MLHIIYRTHSGENKKGRPSYYSKQLALRSFVAAVNKLNPAEVEVIYLADGNIPLDRLQVMEASGEVLTYTGLGLRGSISAAFALPTQRRWAVNDLIWFAEDDYLYQDRALSDLILAIHIFPEADFFGLYAMIGSVRPDGSAAEGFLRIPNGWKGSEIKLVNGHPWRKAISTTHTFGVRMSAFTALQSMMTYATKFGSSFDHSTCLMYQGFVPYSLSFLTSSFIKKTIPRRDLRQTAILGSRMWLNFYAFLKICLGTRARILVAPDPALITHMETEYLAAGTDWSLVARDLVPVDG